MAEPFGIAAGAVSIAAAFTTCVDCFDYVQHGRHFGRDYQTELISLDCARLRLTHWGEAVLVLFADTAKISKTYRLEMKTGDDLTVLAPNDLDPTVFGLRNKMKELALRRQKAGLFIIAPNKDLVNGITSLVDSIEKIFPAPEKKLA
ncbi:hypothetical protein P154DRAFT_571175 [Amniculicola lignicola CBS 123094]|uniref:Prion-inhibition and propagation HeLo domain-containing protein n=1 Tax=Amniculicola lignicola CBS 123094 TaxID=1392246 RepID=A0A6A5WXH0_9PLEO|nr:hypothetical protein P154DRAFT_571175 [Amniculicola lignicola CBS 123094]